MFSGEFIEKSKDLVVEFYNTMIDSDYSLSCDDINILFFSNLENSFKVVLSTHYDDWLYIVTCKDTVFCFDVYNLLSHQSDVFV